MKMVENLLLTVGALLTLLATDPWSSLSNGLIEGKKEKRRGRTETKETFN